MFDTDFGEFISAYINWMIITIANCITLTMYLELFSQIFNETLLFTNIMVPWETIVFIMTLVLMNIASYVMTPHIVRSQDEVNTYDKNKRTGQ